jgi:M6 family metalloprotease-like protein
MGVSLTIQKLKYIQMNKIHNFSIIFALFLGITASYAGPAVPDTIVFTQPDGSRISISLKGDENRHWAITADGYTIVLDKNGYYTYAMHDAEGNLVSSEVVVHGMGERNTKELAFISKIRKGLFYNKQQVAREKSKKLSQIDVGKSFPSKGSNKLACILVSFNDLPFSGTASDFYDLFNMPGYSHDGAQGSVRDYYKEVSYGKLDLNTDVYGTYKLSHNRAYYGSAAGEGGVSEMVAEAVGLADGDIDFSKYDNDGDGVVDGVYIVFAGLSEDSGGPEEAIWSCCNQMADSVVHDGFSFSGFGCSGEFRDFSNNIVRIGVICHETAHVMGAVDYYDTNGSADGEYTGTGSWDLLATGCNNNSGITPSSPNAYVRTQVFKWATPTFLNSAKKGITMKNSSENPVFYYFETPETDENFFLENKSRTGFDKYIPGEGLLIYHRDEGYFNNREHPQGLYPVCASAGMDPAGTPASYGNINDSLCLYTGNYGSGAFTPYTLPSTKSWGGKYAYGQLTNIYYNKSTKIISFDFSGIKVNTIIICARGKKGDEHINLLINDSVIGTGWSLTTSYQNYTATLIGNGDIKVQFDNDASGRDVQIDYILVNGEKRQAENMAYNTGVYANGRCGGGSKSEWLNCNGVIGFGKTTDCIGENTITIQAHGIQGDEHINLLINGNAVGGWYFPSTMSYEFTAKVNGDGDINVQFDNDAPGRDVQIDWVKVNEQRPRLAKDMQYNTGVFVDGKCGGEYSDWLNCNGIIDFGKISEDFAAISANVSECGYSTPMTTALPSINKTYTYMHVIGSTLKLSNVNKFTIQWSLPNKGLYDISYNTGNGTPNWYVSLMGKVTQTFASTSPSITISGSGLNILDGSYWVTMDGDNFVMVSKTGGYAIYCSNSATAPCSSLKSAPLSVFENETPVVTIYPNPSSGSVYIAFEKDKQATADIKILDALGRIVYSQTCTTNEVVPVDGLSKGIYIVNIHYNGNVYNKILIVN